MARQAMTASSGRKVSALALELPERSEITTTAISPKPSETNEEFPEIVIVGGGGYGARLLPSLACLDTEALTTLGATKIGTGRYVDCP